jgi:hypothetical protein
LKLAKIVKVIPLFTDPTATRTGSTVYAAPTNRRRFLYTSGNYDGSLTIYFEAVIRTSSATYAARAGLYTSGGTLVGSVVSTTSITPVRLRTAALTLTTGTMYEVRISPANTSATVTLYSARLIIVQNGTLTKTETPIEIGNSVATTTSITYVDAGSTGRFQWWDKEWSGAVACYLEAILKTNSATYAAYVELTDEANNVVANSEVSTIVTTDGNRIRSASSFTLVNGTTYKIRIRIANASYTATLASAALIVLQTHASGILTKTLSPYPIRPTQHTTVSLSAVALYGNTLWTAGDWDTAIRLFHQVTMMISNVAYVASAMLNDGSDRDTRTTQVAAKTLLRSTLLSLTTGNTFDTQIKVDNASGTNTLSGSMILVSMVDYLYSCAGKITLGGVASKYALGIKSELIFTYGWFTTTRLPTGYELFTRGWLDTFLKGTCVAVGKVQIGGSFTRAWEYSAAGKVVTSGTIPLATRTCSAVGKVQISGSSSTLAIDFWPVLFTNGFLVFLRLATKREVFTFGWLGTSTNTFNAQGKVTIAGTSPSFRLLGNYIYGSCVGGVLVRGIIGIGYEWEIDDITIEKPFPFLYTGASYVTAKGHSQAIGQHDFPNYSTIGAVNVFGVSSSLWTVEKIFDSLGGVVVLGIGEGTFTREYVCEGVGGIVLSGHSDSTRITNYIGSIAGKVVVGGVAATNRSIIKVMQASGKVDVSGITLTSKVGTYNPQGRMIVWGSALYTSKEEYTYLSEGEIAVSGLGARDFVISRSCLGGVVLGGVAATVLFGLAYSPEGKIVLDGSGNYFAEDYLFEYAPDGSMVLLGDAFIIAHTPEWYEIVEWETPITREVTFDAFVRDVEA